VKATAWLPEHGNWCPGRPKCMPAVVAAGPAHSAAWLIAVGVHCWLQNVHVMNSTAQAFRSTQDVTCFHLAHLLPAAGWGQWRWACGPGGVPLRGHEEQR
jgi:hypothetical protein